MAVARNKWLEENRDRWNQWRREHRKKNPDMVRNERLVAKYGVTIEQKRHMIAAQGFVCAACPNPVNDSSHLDHCHVTGKVRGVLCRGCNQALGFVKDNPQTLRALASYLERMASGGR